MRQYNYRDGEKISRCQVLGLGVEGVDVTIKG